MKLVWVLIIVQTIIISYLLFSSKTAEELPRQTKSLEDLRQSSCSSSLSSKNCLNYLRPKIPDCNIAFTFAALIDIRLRLTDVTSKFSPPAEAKHHEKLVTKQDMLETLAYSFSTGRAAEFRVSQELFDLIKEVITDIPQIRILGGNGATMALRAAHEGCETYLIAPVTEEMTKFLPSSINYLNPLIDSPDLHMVFEYREGESWGKYQAPRSNRFYMNYDTKNINPNLFKAASNIDNVNLLVLGGLQLIEGTETEDKFLEEAFNTMQRVKAKNVKVHIEMGDFHSYSFFGKLQKLFSSADSIGMNEQELGILLCHLKKTKFAGYPSKAPIRK